MVQRNLFGEVVPDDAPLGFPTTKDPGEDPQTDAAALEVEDDDNHGEGFGEYNNPIGLSSQFRFCGNPLRGDSYRGCPFGCKYCFANARSGPNEGMFQRGVGPANLRSAVNMLKKAYSKDDTKNSNVECLRRGVPIHLGGMSDPFQPREFVEFNTLKFLQLTEKYKHPVLISTKADHLHPKHWAVLDPARHAFQISLIGIDTDWVRSWETHTPSPGDRLAFMVQLKEKGFWVGLRLQPLIDIEKALELVRAVAGPDPLVDYITVEHLKLPMDNGPMRDELLGLLGEDTHKGLYVSVTRSAEMRTAVKIRNLERIREASSVPVGAGDNDIHELSDSRCCCGLDTIPGPAFAKWLKYNTTFFMTDPDAAKWDPTTDAGRVNRAKVWAPTAKVGGCFVGGKVDPRYHQTYRERVDLYEVELKAGKYTAKNAQITVEEFLALEEGS